GAQPTAEARMPQATRPELTICHGDNLPILAAMPDASAALIYIDPPFNTGRQQQRTTLATMRDAEGDRIGFQGQRYRSEIIGRIGYMDRFDDYLGFLAPRLVEAHRLLTANGSLFVHLDWREVHYVKVWLDGL